MVEKGFDKVEGSSALTQEKMSEALDWCYDKSVNGMPGQKSIDELVEDYLSKHEPEKAIDVLINTQLTKASVSGFLSGLGGVVTMPVSLLANITSVLLVQLRLIAAIAKIRGYDLHDDQVQTQVYCALTGTSMANIAKSAGINIGKKIVTAQVKRIPGTALTKINKAVGFRLITKFGSKGAINLGKAIPVVGGVVGGGFDFVSTKKIALNAKKAFIDVTLIDQGIEINHEDIIEMEVVANDNGEKLTVHETLLQYKELLDNALITQEDYDCKKKELLGL